MDDTVGSLTKVQKSIVLGSLLGDGYLRIVKGRKNAFYEANHAYSQKEYVDWKFRHLKSLCISSPKQRTGNGNRIAYRFFSKQHVELTDLYNLFYKNGKKQIPNIKLDPLAIAVWYMDDGSKCRSSDVYFNTQQFCVEDQMRLIQLLSSYQIQARLNKDKSYSRIRVMKESIRILMNLIQPNIIPTMRYKLVL